MQCARLYQLPVSPERSREHKPLHVLKKTSSSIFTLGRKGAAGVDLTDVSPEYPVFVLESTGPLLLVVLIIKVCGLSEQVLVQVSALIRGAVAMWQCKHEGREKEEERIPD